MSDSINPVRPLWQRRWFQVLLAVLLGLVVLSFILPPIFAVVYELRSILAPVLIGFGLAYVVNPAITYLNVKHRIPRWASTATIMCMGLLIVFTFLLLVVPPLVAQGTELILKVKDVYPRELAELVGEAPAGPTDGGTIDDTVPDADTPEPPPGTMDAPEEPVTPAPAPAVEGSQAAPGEGTDADAAAEAPLEETADQEAAESITETDAGAAPAVAPIDGLSWRELWADPQQRQILLDSLAERFRKLDWATISSAAARSLDIGVGVVGSAISFTTYILLALVIIAFCFFYFAWRFSQVTGWFASFIPASRRDATLELIRKMDRSVNAFIRGRLVQAAVMMAVLSVGWWIAGVPYFLLLGVLSGLLNLVPFLVVIGWIVALVLTLVDHTTGTHGFTLWTILGPTLVYVFAQSLDGWVVEPVVQGRATNLDPLTVLLVVLIGGTLAGLLGMLLAIPTAACIKILATDLVLPRLRQLAAEN